MKNFMLPLVLLLMLGISFSSCNKDTELDSKVAQSVPQPNAISTLPGEAGPLSASDLIPTELTQAAVSADPSAIFLLIGVSFYFNDAWYPSSPDYFSTEGLATSFILRYPGFEYRYIPNYGGEIHQCIRFTKPKIYELTHPVSGEVFRVIRYEKGGPSGSVFDTEGNLYPVSKFKNGNCTCGTSQFSAYEYAATQAPFDANFLYVPGEGNEHVIAVPAVFEEPTYYECF
ncbi:MAG: hypothetical protein AAGG75_05995 [Bacteroidota bacterium]